MGYDSGPEWRENDGTMHRRITDGSQQPNDEAPTRSRSGHGTYLQPQPPQRQKHTVRKVLLGVGAVLVAGIIIGAATSGGKTDTTSATASDPTDAGPSGYPSPYSTEEIIWASPSDDGYTDVPLYSQPETTQASVAEKVTYRCTGHAPDGIDITYGPEGSNYSASHLPFTKSVTLDDSAGYYAIQGQLSGAGSVTCTLTVQTSDGAVVTQSGSASGGYNIASAEICSTFDGSWEKC